MDNDEVAMNISLPKSILEAKGEELLDFLSQTALDVYRNAKSKLSKNELADIGATTISTLVCTRILYIVTKNESKKDIVDAIKGIIQTGSNKDFYIELNFK